VASSSALTGTYWHGGLSIFSTEGTGPLTGKYQWTHESGGLCCLTKIVSGERTLIITGCMDGGLSLHPFGDQTFQKTSGEVQSWPVHLAPVSSVAAQKDRLVSTGWDSRIHLHILEGTGFKNCGSVVGHYKPIHGVSWASDSTFVTVGQDGDIKLWDIRTAESNSKVAPKPSISISTQRPGYAVSAAESNVAVGQDDGVTIYDLKKSLPSKSFKSPVPTKAVQFNPRVSKYLAFGSDNGQTGVLNIQEKQISSSYNGQAHGDFVRGVSWDLKGFEYISVGWAPHSDKSLDINVHPLKLE